MDSSVISWLSPPVMNNPIFINQCDGLTFGTFDEDFAAVFGEDNLIDVPSSNSLFYYNTSPGMEQPKILQQTPDLDNYSQHPNIQSCMINPDQNTSAPIIPCFGNHNLSRNMQQENPMQSNPQETVVDPEIFMSRGSYNVNAEETTPIKVQPAKKKARIRPQSQTYDHIIAERRRREQLSQLFVALSALVPGLKKMDKGSVLEDAIKYMKHLQEKVRILEVKAENQAVESVVVVKKSQIVVEDEGSPDEQSCTSLDEQPLPEIEARACENHMLLRVHFEKQKGVLVKLVTKVESMNMIVVNTNATPFGNVALDVTIIAELEKEFKLTVKEVVTALREALRVPKQKYVIINI